MLLLRTNRKRQDLTQPWTTMHELDWVRIWCYQWASMWTACIRRPSSAGL